MKVIQDSLGGHNLERRTNPIPVDDVTALEKSLSMTSPVEKISSTQEEAASSIDHSVLRVGRHGECREMTTFFPDESRNKLMKSTSKPPSSDRPNDREINSVAVSGHHDSISGFGEQRIDPGHFILDLRIPVCSPYPISCW